MVLTRTIARSALDGLLLGWDPAIWEGLVQVESGNLGLQRPHKWIWCAAILAKAPIWWVSCFVLRQFRERCIDSGHIG